MKYCNENNYNVEFVVNSTGIIEGIAIDWIGKNVFWSDSKQGYIGISNYNGSLTGKITITTVENSTHVFEKPRSIAVDPVKGTFFSLLRFPQLTYLFEFANFKVTFFGLIGD